jgi:23S rRNA (guanosine2251-2'-O)-methyltransferase
MTFVAFGIHTVGNLLNSPYFTFKKIILLENRDNKSLVDSIEAKKIPYQILDKVDFSRYNFDKKNQGVVAFIKEYLYVDLFSLLRKKPNNKFPFLVMLDRIEDPHNFGAILRTCAAFSVDGIIIANKNQAPINSTVVKISTGGVAYVPVCQVNNLLEAINELKKANYQIISTICSPESKTLDKFDFNFPICLIFGNEHEGIKNSIIKKSEGVYIPVEKSIGSLNVSVSCGIFLAWVNNKIKNNHFA